MNIIAIFTTNGVPQTGLSATITIVKKSDNSVVVSAQAMTERGTGAYIHYDYSYVPTAGETYYFICNAGVDTVDSRYAGGTFGTELTDILADTNELQTDITNGGRVDLLVDAIKAKTDNLPASPAAVGSAMTLASGAITAAVVAANAIDADALATDAVNEIADAVWDEAIVGHLGAGTTGASLNAAGSSGDPWATSLPGAYGAGTAGNIVGGLGLTGPSELVVTVVDDSENTIQGVLIALYSSSDQLLTTALTNVSGQVTFMVENSNYYFRCYKIGYGFTYPITVTISGDTEKEITASVVTIVSPTPASVCRVYEYLLDLSGINPLATTAVEGLATAYVLPTDLGDALIEGVPVEGTYDSTTGLIYWDIAQGAIVSFRIPVVGLSKTVEIPESGSARLYDIEAI